MQRGQQSLVTSIIFTALSFIFIIIRVISRFVIVRQPGWEDYLIMVAWFTSAALTVIVGLQNANGLGRHATTVSQEENITLLKLLYASVLEYNTGLFLVKISILCQYLRFLVHKSYRRAAWGLIGLIAIGGSTFLLVAAFNCRPVDFFWTKATGVAKGKCINQTAFWFALSGFSILTDLAVWALPLPVLKDLQLPKRTKYSLLGVFSLGLFGCITSMLRLHALYVTTHSTDITYSNVDAVTWSAVELNIGIMCASIPAIRPFVTMLFPRLLGTSARGTGSNTFPRRAGYYRNDSVVELSNTGRMQSNVGRGARDSFGTDEGRITVKHEWAISAREDV